MDVVVTMEHLHKMLFKQMGIVPRTLRVLNAGFVSVLLPAKGSETNRLL